MERKTHHCYCFNRDKDAFISWLVQLLGPVLLSVKPAEILSFPQKDEEGIERMKEVKNIFDSSSRIKYREFYSPTHCTKIFFYNPAALDRFLRDRRNQKFLQSIGYPKDYEIERYVDYIVNEMKSGQIPSEIGVFLGYPLKDVLGFIGHPSLKLTKVNGWRVYGDPKISDERYGAFINAKNRVRILLQNNSPQHIVHSA